MSAPAPPPPPLPPCNMMNTDTDSDDNNRSYCIRETQTKEDMTGDLLLDLERILGFPANQDKTAVVFLSPVQPMLQVGPVCGLVALGMAADHFSPGCVAEETVFHTAKSQNMTKRGEMFSAQEMKDLAAATIPSANTELVNSESPGILSKVVSTLLNEDLILIPYDSDHNHSPTNRQGHSAHWALLIGFAALLPTEELKTELSSLDGEATIENGIMFGETLIPAGKKAISKLLQHIPSSHVYLCARQGKSLHVGLWAYDDLIRSNQNLLDVGEKFKEKGDKFVLHPVDLTLRAKLILLQKNSYY